MLTEVPFFNVSFNHDTPQNETLSFEDVFTHDDSSVPVNFLFSYLSSRRPISNSFLLMTSISYFDSFSFDYSEFFIPYVKPHSLSYFDKSSSLSTSWPKPLHSLPYSAPSISYVLPLSEFNPLLSSKLYLSLSLSFFSDWPSLPYFGSNFQLSQFSMSFSDSISFEQSEFFMPYLKSFSLSYTDYSFSVLTLWSMSHLDYNSLSHSGYSQTSSLTSWSPPR